MMNPVEVLMVEDNRGDVVLVQTAIEQVGLPYRLTILSDGAEVVDLLHRRGTFHASPRPALIMLDLQLPRRSGCEVLQEIRRDLALMEIPVVLMSSSKRELEAAQSLALAVACFFEKPSTFQGFVAMLEAIESFRLKTLKARQGG